MVFWLGRLVVQSLTTSSIPTMPPFADKLIAISLSRMCSAPSMAIIPLASVPTGRSSFHQHTTCGATLSTASVAVSSCVAAFLRSGDADFLRSRRASIDKGFVATCERRLIHSFAILSEWYKKPGQINASDFAMTVVTIEVVPLLLAPRYSALDPAL